MAQDNMNVPEEENVNDMERPIVIVKVVIVVITQQVDLDKKHKILVLIDLVLTFIVILNLDTHSEKVSPFLKGSYKRQNNKGIANK